MKTTTLSLLICVVITLATCDEVPKIKRDLVLVKKLIAAAIHGDKHVNRTTVPQTITTTPPIHNSNEQIPGFMRVPINLVNEQINKTKKCATVPVKEVDRTKSIIANIRSSLAEKSNSETLNAAKNFLYLGLTGVGSGTIVKNVKIPTAASPIYYIQTFPNYEIPLYNILQYPKTINQQLYPVIEENTPLILPPPICNIPNSCVPSPVKKPLTFPPEPVLQFTYPRNPLDVPLSIIPPVAPVPPFQPKYSYKQIKSDGSVTTYEVDSKGEVLVSETPKVTSSSPHYAIDRYNQLSSNLQLSPIEATYRSNVLTTTTQSPTITHVSADEVAVPSAFSLPQKSSGGIKFQQHHSNPENVGVNIDQTPLHIEDVQINYSNDTFVVQKKNQTESNKVDFEQKPHPEVQNAVESILRVSDEIFSESKPIVVADEPSFLYKQNKPNGSLHIVRGINDTVSVQIDESTKKLYDKETYRGDIP